uniref:Cytochrome P450, family 2, subfamily X, polypeptide 9 n=1 Tax=Acanthochromis polyacanthus TaxID=80966 RepID=A0A3Q1EIH7_9TELE
MFLSLVLLGLCICFIILHLTPRRPKNFPPGPPVLPILGNILHLNLKNPLEDFEKLRKSYGNVYSLFLGPRPSVVINGVKAMKEAMRPGKTVPRFTAQSGGKRFCTLCNIVLEHRRKSAVLQHFSTVLCEFSNISFTGKTLTPQIMFHNVASNIMCQVVFGTRYEYDDEFITTIVQSAIEITKAANGPWTTLYSSFPWIRKLPLPFNKSFKAGKQKSLNEHKKTRVPGEPRDFLDSEDSTFSEDKLIFTAIDLMIAGTDTTSNTLLTAFLYLINHPHIQERCQQEIDRVLEGKDQVCFDDRHQMPYVQAVIHEVQRIANTVPLSVFHCTTKDTELAGYSIPKGTRIIQNLTTVLKEEGQWKYPHEFNPGNFLNDQGEFVKPDAFMPFSAGPRVCLGEGLARMELFLIMVTLLRKFKFIWPEDTGEPDYTPVFGITMTPKPYPMKVQHRL